MRLPRTPLILIPGTWRGKWATDTGHGTLRDHLEVTGFEPRLFRGWSSDIDGLPSIFGLGHDDDGDPNTDWRAGGWSLRYYLSRIPFSERNLLVHSHGINPVLYQATLPANGEAQVPIRTLVSVCSPSREDMQSRAEQAVIRGLIGRWHHVHAIGWDFFARAGQLFDGNVGWRLKWPAAHQNIGLKDIGHSKLLNDPSFRPHLDAILEVCHDAVGVRPPDRGVVV